MNVIGNKRSCSYFGFFFSLSLLLCILQFLLKFSSRSVGLFFFIYFFLCNGKFCLHLFSTWSLPLEVVNCSEDSHSGYHFFVDFISAESAELCVVLRSIIKLNRITELYPTGRRMLNFQTQYPRSLVLDVF